MEGSVRALISPDPAQAESSYRLDRSPQRQGLCLKNEGSREWTGRGGRHTVPPLSKPFSIPSSSDKRMKRSLVGPNPDH